MSIDLDNRYIKQIQKALFFIASIFVVAQLSKLFLPSYGVSLSQSSVSPIEYKKYSIFEIQQNKTPKQVIEDVVIAQSISQFRLKALMYESKYSGYIIIEDSADTQVLSIGDNYKGYKLKSLTSKSALFVKNGELSSLSLSNEWEDTAQTPTKSNNYKSIYKNNTYEIKKSDIHNYAKHPKQIWKNIRISPAKKDGKIVGYKIKSVKKNSVFDKLGIKKDDMITKVNNIKLSSNKDALKLYKDIDKLDNILITVQRGTKEVELEYELQ
jgi:general secretion pathway protein C